MGAQEGLKDMRRLQTQANLEAELKGSRHAQEAKEELKVMTHGSPMGVCQGKTEERAMPLVYLTRKR